MPLIPHTQTPARFPRERIRYLARQIHPLGERPLGEIFLRVECRKTSLAQSSS